MNVGDGRYASMNRVLTGAIAVLCVVASGLWLDRVQLELDSGYSELRATAQAWMCASMHELFDSHAWPMHMGTPDSSRIALREEQRR